VLGSGMPKANQPRRANLRGWFVTPSDNKLRGQTQPELTCFDSVPNRSTLIELGGTPPRCRGQMVHEKD
jgi:hypothetical protein